jgi:hypothetical protein
MPTPTQYSFTISTAFPSAKVDASRLTNEIYASSIVTALDHIDTSGDACDVWFKDALSGDDQAVLNGIVAAHSGEPVPDNTPQKVQLYVGEIAVPATADGLPRLAVEKGAGPAINFFSHNWCDKTTWYTKSVYVADETATDSGDHTSYTLAHQFVIDSYHGKVTQEDFLKDSSNRSYRVTVKVNGTTKTEVDPHFDALNQTVGDYRINYAAGTVTFVNALTANDVVTATYHYSPTTAGNSMFIVAPLPTKTLIVNLAECNFSEDFEMKDTVLYTPVGYVDVFAPQLLQANGGPFAPGTKIPLASAFTYKTVQDFLNDSMRAYPGYPPIGGSSWRGMPKTSYVFDWDYIRGKTFYSQYGMEIQCTLQHDEPFGGTFATAAFYCNSEPE